MHSYAKFYKFCIHGNFPKFYFGVVLTSMNQHTLYIWKTELMIDKFLQWVYSASCYGKYLFINTLNLLNLSFMAYSIIYFYSYSVTIYLIIKLLLYMFVYDYVIGIQMLDCRWLIRGLVNSSITV